MPLRAKMREILKLEESEDNITQIVADARTGHSCEEIAPMRTLTAFKLVRMFQGEHRTEAEFEGTGAEGGQEITLILNNIDA